LKKNFNFIFANDLTGHYKNPVFNKEILDMPEYIDIYVVLLKPGVF